LQILLSEHLLPFLWFDLLLSVEPMYNESLLLIILQGINVVIKCILRALHHLLPESLGGDREVALHLVNVIRLQDQHLTSFNTLNCEVTTIDGPKSILLKTEIFFVP